MTPQIPAAMANARPARRNGGSATVPLRQSCITPFARIRQGRRLLCPFERDAIVHSLQDHNGSKVRAAEGLYFVPGHGIRQDPRARDRRGRHLKDRALVQTENQCMCSKAYGFK